MENNNLQIDNINFLEHSLIYAMSLGSKELFHSNVWAWLMKKDNRFINVFFPNIDLKIYKVEEISREYKNRDIIIRLKKGEEKYYLVIENKIKSLPNEEQLKTYSVDLNKDILLDAVFTGIINPFADKTIKIKNKDKTVNWHYIDYEYIANEFLKITNTFNQNKEHIRLQVLDYCQVIKSIKIVLYAELAKTPNHLDYSLNGVLKQLRLHDLFFKLKGATFIRYVNDRILELGDNKINKFYRVIRQGFNQGQVTLDFTFSNWKKDGSPFSEIGIQIQGTQYRIFVASYGIDDKYNDKGDVYEEYGKLGWFDVEYNKYKKKEIFGKATSMKDKYCQYNGGAFIYQYYNITNETNSFEFLFNSIKKDLKKAFDILQKNK